MVKWNIPRNTKINITSLSKATGLTDKQNGNTYKSKSTTEETYRKMLQLRGMKMTETQKKIITPTKLEFNFDKGSEVGDLVEHTQQFFTLLTHEDITLKIVNAEQDRILYEIGSEIQEGEEFRENFKVRELTFRKGNKKVILYFTIESKIPVNRIKFANPVKQYLQKNNIWLKPDLFSTKMESSPGFFTLIHPRMTNKEDLKDKIKKALGQTKIDNTDKPVKNWTEKHNLTNTMTEKYIPMFHMENSVRKWGGIQVEVIKIVCQEEDTEYMKYLFSLASSQKKIERGLFVPTGIQLMEAKEVLTSLLTEHKEFNDTVTSYQIDGISNKDMLSKTDKEPESIKELLLQCEGILAVERTFHTETKGQWLLVIQKNKTQTVTNYINSNIEKIYRKKREKKTRLITYKSDATSKAYRLQIVPTYTGKVGTYAEVLKKRFVKNTQTQKPSDATRNEKPSEKNYTENNFHNTDQDNINFDLREDSILHFPPLEDTGTKEINTYEHKNKHSNNISQDTVTVSNTGMNENKETNLNKEMLEKSKTVQQLTNKNNRRTVAVSEQRSRAPRLIDLPGSTSKGYISG